MRIIAHLKLPDNPTQIFLLSREKLAGGDLLRVAHAGIGFRHPDGQLLVLHRTPENNTHVSTYEEFAAGQNVSRKPVTGNFKEILSRASFCLTQSKTYSALFSNCEHLTNFVIDGKLHSDQLQGATLGAGISLVAACTVLKDSPGWVKALVVAGGTMLASHLAKEKLLSSR